MNHLGQVKSKIFGSYAQLKPTLDVWRGKGETIVFTNGCFDIFHRGHIEYLSKSADLGGRLVVGLNSDESVKKLKGSSRPLFDQESRALLLASLSFIDAVVIFPEETPYNLIKEILPNILVKGNDYAIEKIAGFDVVLENGGKVETIDLVPSYSTSNLIKKIKGDE
jgi:D-glycero-beta-D-manno-heptose 1-phosphate adenylyltransferase